MTATTAPPPGTWQGYAAPVQPGSVPAQRHSSHRKVIGLLALAVALTAGVVVGVASLLTPTPQRFVCPPTCGKPPTATPIAALPRFTGPGGAYSFEYLPTGGAITASRDRTGVTESITGDIAGTVRLFGTDAQGRTAQQEAEALIGQAYSSARRAYVVPNAFVGYQPGYGEVDDVQLQTSTGGYAHERLVVMVAVKNGVALVGEAVGDYHAFTPADGHASAVGLLVAPQLLDPLINTFAWQGDPPR